MLLISGTIFAQDYGINTRTRLYTQEIGDDSLALMADNDFFIPVSLQLQMDLQNLRGDSISRLFTVIPPNSRGQRLAAFKRTLPGASYKCNYSWKIVLGDTSKRPDLDYPYSYPYQQGFPYQISQGPGGTFSHQNSYAFDFSMPVGTPVTAARDGVVALVSTDSDVGGIGEEFIDKANFISVLHSDGTIANYYHLNKNGSMVREGQKVDKGQMIGLSGNTGLSAGPHLHFEIIQPSMTSQTKKWVNFRWEHSLYAVNSASGE